MRLSFASVVIALTTWLSQNVVFGLSEITKSEFSLFERYPYYVVLGGIEGPFFALQGFATASVGFYFTENFGLSAQVSSGSNSEKSDKNSKRHMKGQIYALQATYIPFFYEAGDYFRNFFIRQGPSWQNLRVEKCVDRCNVRNDESVGEFLESRKESQWRALLFGWEFAPGIFFKSTSKLSGEFIPLTFFYPLQTLALRNTHDSNVDYAAESAIRFRILTWRLGWVF